MIVVVVVVVVDGGGGGGVVSSSWLLVVGNINYVSAATICTHPTQSTQHRPGNVHLVKYLYNSGP